MILNLNKESLASLNGKIKEEIDNYSGLIDNVVNELNDLNMVIQGKNYDDLMNNYNYNKEKILFSKEILTEYHNIINKCLINYTNLSEGVKYDE